MPSTLTDLSIVISSFNREDKVLKTVQSLFESDLSGLETIEVIIVDDGSPKPVRELVPAFGPTPSNISLRLLEQKNVGIGATRNRGFNNARADLVIFLDDDIILENDTIKKLYQAEEEHPGAVIFGNYPFITHNSKSLYQFAKLLYCYDKITQDKVIKQVDAITSGLLLVNKGRLGYPEKLYRDDMTIPAAEEHEIIARFHRMGIPIFHAQHIKTIHNHHLKLDWLSQQQYKYGLATAEAFIKYPEILDMTKFQTLKKNLDNTTFGIKNITKSILASKPGKKILLGVARLIEKLLPNNNHNTIFGVLTTSYFRAGYKEGLKRFQKRGAES